MADVKWSNNTSFVPQTSLNSGDNIMGLTSGNVNAKYPQSLFVLNNATSQTPTQSYVSTGGNDSNNGNILNPFLTVGHAISTVSSGTQINVSPGAFSTTGNITLGANTYLNGADRYETSYTISGSIGIDQTKWTASTTPIIEIKNMGFSCGSIDFNPTTFKANATFNVFNTDFKIGAGLGDFTIHNIANLNIENSKFGTLTLEDHSNVIIRNCQIMTGNIETSFTGVTNNYPVMNIYIDDVDMNGNQLVFINEGLSFVSTYNIVIRNLRNCDLITYVNNGGPSPYTATINIDLASMPSHGISDGSFGDLTITIADDLSYADTTVGIGVNNPNATNYFKWSGNLGGPSNNYNLVAGQGAHTTAGPNNCTLLGPYSTSSRSGCFVASDGTATALANHFPALDNQAIFYFAGGFGIGAPNNTPQAGFHYGHAYGNDGNILLSAVGTIADGKMAASEVNPAVTNNGITFKYKTSGGTAQYAYVTTPIEVTGTSQALSAGCEYIANNASLVTFTYPSTALVGDKYRIVGKGAGLFKIAQNTSQSTVFLDKTTASGTSGSITAMQQYQVIEIECITANTGFSVTYASGYQWTMV